MSLAKNSIVVKLAGGFGICVLLLVLLVVYNSVNLQRLGKLYVETWTRSNHMNLAAEARGIGDHFEAIIAHAVINRDLEKSVRDWASAKEINWKKLQMLAAAAETPEEQQEIGKAEAAFGDIVRIYEKEMLPLIVAGAKASDGQIASIDARLDERVEDMERMLQNLMELEAAENRFAEQKFHAVLRDTVAFGLGISILGVIAALSIAVISTRRISRPLEEITCAAREMEQGNYTVMLAHRAEDETGVLADAFRRMSGEVNRRTEQMEQLTMQLSHEIAERTHAEEEVRTLNASLERRVAERTADLVAAVQALEKEVAERTTAERALRASEERYALVIMGANEGIWDWDLKSGSVFLSPRLKNILGYDDDELPNEREAWLTKVHPDDYPLVMATMDRSLSGESEAYELEYRITHRDGGIRWVLSRGACMHDESGRVKRIAGSVMDITARKRAEDDLKRGETMLRIVLEMLPVGIWVADAGGSVVMINKAGKQIWCGRDYDDVELVGDIRGWRPETGEKLNKEDWPLARAVSRRESTFNEIIEIETLTGERKIVSHSAVPVLDAASKLIAAVAVSEDITEKRLADERLKASHKQLRMLYVHLDSVREDERAILAREVHDELGQQLTVLKFDASWLKGKLPATEQALIKKTESMKELIDATINTVRRIATELRPRLLDELGLSAAIEWYAGQFRERTGITCRLGLEVAMDGLQKRRATTLFRIFQEAMTNVVRHSGASDVTVSLRRKGDRIVLEVADNGRGISRKALADPRSVGLAGMRERVAQWGGKISINGESGKGTTVKASLPLAGEEERNDQDSYRR